VVQGTVLKEELLCRDAARPGDVIFSTGFLGDSKAGLHLILNEIDADNETLEALLKAHLVPEPHLREGRFLARRSGVNAAIDTSDGLRWNSLYPAVKITPCCVPYHRTVPIKSRKHFKKNLSAPSFQLEKS
jgi:thiamine-monophosphate kinase